LDRKERVARLVDHSKNPRHSGALEDADVLMPGGSPECGGSVVVYVKGDGDRITALSFTGEGDTISMGASSMILEKTLDEELTMQQVLDLDYDEWVDFIGRDVVGSRTRNATMGLSTLKSAIRKYQRDNARSEQPRAKAV
jgi:nitrogen fixation protein NifU and related proteins